MDRKTLIEIITSHPSFDPLDPPTYETFTTYWFDHPEYRGYGRELLRRAGHRTGLHNYRVFLGGLFPEARAFWIMSLASGGYQADVLEPLPEEYAAEAQLMKDNDTDELDLDTLIDARSSAAIIESAFRALSQRERHILRLYWEMDGRGPYTLEMIGEGYGVGRSRIQQIIQKAEERLRTFYTAWEESVSSTTVQEPEPEQRLREEIPQTKKTFTPHQYARLVAECAWDRRSFKPLKYYRAWIDDFVQTWMRRHHEAYVSP